jgi:RimJ/RimL family protein N-acetyltransferase
VKLLERLCFALEGCLREKYVYKGGVHDELVYGLLRRDWGR